MASQASLLLQKQLKDLCKNPVDGFSAGLVDETNIFEWSVTIIGPPDTLYEGGFFNAIMSFPPNYPNSPPTVKFTSEIWHPNVYPDGRVCISILHPPGDDPNGYELASERWMPVHTVESIVLSIISMLSSPNDESPANVEAAVRYLISAFACNVPSECLMKLPLTSTNMLSTLLLWTKESKPCSFIHVSYDQYFCVNCRRNGERGEMNSRGRSAAASDGHKKCCDLLLALLLYICTQGMP
ncbi:Ubiquitin-conjugating enzyme 13 isoform 1 [Theobroma cacao]|uniref:E2 ubiquitin-conjugating enzyme n=1 Tax=Theobroma cacao TaxID=3641 RepID=A0A061H034_THECC|nr:Ubiquitin-conjugating enzyme 13 isoform 1 [Theobroma cacao]